MMAKLTKEQRERNAARARAWYRFNFDTYKNSRLLKCYGITLKQYEAMNTDGCHVCGNQCPSKRRLAVDHDHVTGVVRGLLCINCNKGLGNFKDSIEMLKKAIEYLRKQNAANQKFKQESFQEERRDGDEG